MIQEIPSNIKKTFHRAFDVCSDFDSCFKQIDNLGIDKLLTSGGKKTAFEGRELIARLVKMSKESTKRIGIICGAGVNSSNLELILKETGCREFHSSCRSSRRSKMIFKNMQVSMGSPLIDEFEINYSDKDKVFKLAQIYKSFFG